MKRLVGYLPERVGFYEELTAAQNLRYTADLNRISKAVAEPRILEVLETVGLKDVVDQPVSTYSRGMKQRLGLADIWLKEPKLAFLDEPTTGIDPNGIDDVLKLISAMAKRGITIIFCSHVLPQVQRICSRVGILSKGVLVADGPIDALGRDSERYRMEAEVDDMTPAVIDAVKGISGVEDVEAQEKMLIVTASSDLRGQVSRAIIDSGALLLGMRIEEFNLERIYKRFSKEAQ